MTQPQEPQEPNTPPTAPEPSAQPAPAPTPPATPPASTPPAGDNGLSALAAQIGAMPERIVDSLREALAPARAPQADPPPAGDTNTADKTPGKKEYKSFGHRWFGVS